jgi:hypothetical protein
MLGSQAHIGQLQTQAIALGWLGINTANVYAWPGGGEMSIPATQINGVLNSCGITWRSQGVYNPLQVNDERAYFDFYLEPRRNKLDAWAQGLANYTQVNNGGDRVSVAEFALADEVAWIPASLLSAVRTDESFLEYYGHFLQKHAQLTLPGNVEGLLEKLSSMVSTGTAADESLDLRRFYHWTMRFFQESASRGLALARGALEKVFLPPNPLPGYRFHVFANYKNGMGRWLDAQRQPSTGYDAFNRILANCPPLISFIKTFSIGLAINHCRKRRHITGLMSTFVRYYIISHNNFPTI